MDWHPGAEPRSTVVLLHGGGVDSASLSWGEVGARLSAAGHRVVAPDHPGFGESPRAPWVASQDRLVAYVGEFVDAVGLDQYTVGGLSLGGGLTIGHVLAHPERVTGTMMLGCYGLMNRQTDGPFSLPMHVMTWLMLRTGLLSLAQHAYGRNRRMLAKGMRVIIRDSDRLTDELLDELMSAAQREGPRPRSSNGSATSSDGIGPGRTTRPSLIASPDPRSSSTATGTPVFPSLARVPLRSSSPRPACSWWPTPATGCSGIARTS